jgi:hypothetical protein
VTTDPSPGAPSASQQGALLYDNWWLDVPKLLDIAALYGPSNQGLVGRFMQQLVQLQPRYMQVGRGQICFPDVNLSGADAGMKPC